MMVLLFVYISWGIMPLIHSNYGFHLEFLSSVDIFGRLIYVVRVKVQTEPALVSKCCSGKNHHALNAW